MMPGYGVPRISSLAKVGAGFTIFGGILIGIGWLIPDPAPWWAVIAFGWFLLAIGLGVGILGAGQVRR